MNFSTAVGSVCSRTRVTVYVRDAPSAAVDVHDWRVVYAVCVMSPATTVTPSGATGLTVTGSVAPAVIV